MKIDRLLAITVYLLNHDRASAKVLSDQFHVSVRTIQRDMVSLSQAGIPVWAEMGHLGGYAILEEYKIKNQALKADDIQMVLKALESLRTSYQNPDLSALIEKYASMDIENSDRHIYWDFSVARENAQVQSTIDQLERAIAERRVVRFCYRTVQGIRRDKTVHPLAIHYQWRAWYVLIWDFADGAYKTCKVARISMLDVTDEICERVHGDIRALMRASLEAYYESYSKIEVAFRPEEDLSLMYEYFPDCSIRQTESGDMHMIIEVPPQERYWQALLLSFGDAVTIIDPPEYRNRLIETAKNFLSNYDI